MNQDRSGNAILRCTHCDGTGRVPDASFKGVTICPDCGGSGDDPNPPEWFIKRAQEAVGVTEP